MINNLFRYVFKTVFFFAIKNIALSHKAIIKIITSLLLDEEEKEKLSLSLDYVHHKFDSYGI
jgi:hypothetical protein